MNTPMIAKPASTNLFAPVKVPVVGKSSWGFGPRKGVNDTYSTAITVLY